MDFRYELGRGLNALRTFNYFRDNRYVYWRMLRHYIHVMITGDETPRNMVIQLTNRCNARCRICYARASEARRQELTLAEIFACIDEANRMSCSTVTLSGGEPFLHERLEEIVGYLTGKRLIGFTSTNGLLASGDYLDRLKKAGLVALNFNVLGWEDRHDEQVGIAGAFRRIQQSVRHALGVGLVVLINHVTTREALQTGDTYRIIEHFMDMGCNGISLLDPCLFGPNKEILLTPEEYAQIADLEKADYIFKDVKNYPGGWKCPAGSGDLYISAYGDVCPCPFIPISFGNIRQEPIPDVFHRIHVHPMFKKEFPHCRAARDRDFIEQYLVPVFEGEINPLPVEQHPALSHSRD